MILRLAFPLVVLSVLLTSTTSRAVDAAEPPKTLLLPSLAVVGGVDPNIALSIADLLAERLSRGDRYSVVAGDDLRQMLNLDAERQLAGCENDSCAAEIAATLDADYVLFGRVSQLGEHLIIRLTFFNARSAEAEERLVIRAMTLNELPDAIDTEVGRFVEGRPKTDTPADASADRFPWTIVGGTTVLAGVGAALVTLGVVGGIYLALQYPKAFQLTSEAYQGARNVAIGSLIVGGAGSVVLLGAGSAFVAVGLVE